MASLHASRFTLHVLLSPSGELEGALLTFHSPSGGLPQLREHCPNGVRMQSKCCTSADEALLLCWQCKFTKIFPNYLNMVQVVYDELLTAVNFFGSSIGCPSPLFIGLLTICKNIRLKMGYFLQKWSCEKCNHRRLNWLSDLKAVCYNFASFIFVKYSLFFQSTIVY